MCSAHPGFIRTLLLVLVVCAANPAHADTVLMQQFEQLRHTEDLDGMTKRRFVRALVVYSKTFYFVDRGRERGLVAEGIRQFEAHLNRKLRTKDPQSYVHVVAVPVSRDELVPWLLQGRGDLAAANITITPERERLVDFSAPFYDNASEILVTGADIPAPRSLEDLSGQDVFVSKSSSYHDSLIRLNRSFRGTRRPIRVQLADERLEDEDLLEMVNAGLIPRIVTDDYNARFWARVFPGIRLYPQIPLTQGGRIAWAFRKQSPRLKAMVDSFVASHKVGTAVYNDAYRRYFATTKWVKNAAAEKELAKFRATVELFKKYGEQYGFDYLMMTAQGYQESQLDQGRRSASGAVGVMQVMPSTGRMMKVGDIRKLEPNIHAGIKYMRLLADQHFAAAGIDPFNRTLFCFAAYNAGPTRVAELRREAAGAGLNPDAWFNNVERIAALRVGRETVQYVANIYKYYIAYRLLDQQRREREQATGMTP